jgi:hypothetical protein
MAASWCWSFSFFLWFCGAFFYASEMAAGGDGVNAVDAMQNVLILR